MQKVQLAPNETQLLVRSCTHDTVAMMIRQSGRVAKSAVIVINMVSIKNLLSSFCCILEKSILRRFSQLGGLGKQF